MDLKDLLIHRVIITTGLENINGDLEVRVGALKGEQLAIDQLKGQSPETRQQILEQHMDSIEKATKFINIQFNLLDEMSKKHEKAINTLSNNNEE